MNSPQSTRIGADVGGTFTDVVLERDGVYHSTKTLTTHAAPEVGILGGIGELLDEHNLEWHQLDQIIHGTTLATNALIERRGARTAFVTTKGFRDVIETRTEGRFEQYDLNIELPTPLIGRADRYVVPERLNARGEVLLDFDDAAADAVIDTIIAQGYESVAVGFLHAYRNSTHEQRFRDRLVPRAPELSVSLSAEVSPQMREFERFNTVCANAYVQPLIASYLGRLRDELGRRGVTAPIYLIHSGGGLIDVDSAARFPVRLVESGPAGGAIFAAHLAQRYGRERVVSYDMGGTTAKISLIENGVPETAKTFEVARTARFKQGSGMPISIPVIEMIEIGAGGGSVASIDALQQIRIGPESAGSEPGPAAYNLGGDAPTVTDANVQLGRIRPDTFGATAISLAPDRAASAIAATIGTPLALDTTTAAVGIVEMVDENMSNAARVHAVENGKNLAEFSMIAYGGAAPLHASRLLDKLGLDEVFVPAGAGVGSAIGFLLAPFAYEAVRSFYTISDDFDVAGAQQTLDELADEAERFVRAGAGSDVDIEVERKVSMRYRGQGWEIPVSIPAGRFDAVAADALITEFVKTYERYFGRPIDGLAIELVSWSVRVASQLSPVTAIELAEPGPPVTSETQGRVYDPTLGHEVDASIYQRASLAAGDTVSGPALIVEPQTTTVLGSGHAAVVQPDRTLRVTRLSADPIRGARTGDVHHQIMWNRLVAVVEEQARTLVRTSFSTSVREAGDLSAGVFDARGRLIAQAVTGTPGHVNTMAAAISHFINDIGADRIHDGDVYVTNDPWKGTGHLHDFTMCTPVFRHEKLIGFFASTSHVVDIGGRGYGPDASELYEEGLRVPIMRWADRGRLNDDLINILRNNVRESDQVIGDLHGLAACNDTGRRRLHAMLDEFALDSLDDLATFVFDRTRRAVDDALARVPNGTYHNSMDVDGYDAPVHLEATLTVTDNGIHADFTGTSATSRFGINVPITYAEAYFTYGMIVALAPELPNNFASLEPFTVAAPRGVVLNAQAPDPVSVRHVIGHFVTDLGLGALAGVLPDRIPAEGAGALWNFQASARAADPEQHPLPPVELLMFNSGGTGARPGLDGMTATAFPSGVNTMSVEATEQVGPIIIWRKQIRDDSGGRGAHRGGHGQIIEVGATDGYQLLFSAMFDRVEHPARGRHGGTAGAAGKVYLDDGSAFRSKGKQWIPTDRHLVMELPGGGGWGPANGSDD